MVCNTHLRRLLVIELCVQHAFMTFVNKNNYKIEFQTFVILLFRFKSISGKCFNKYKKVQWDCAIPIITFLPT